MENGISTIACAVAIAYPLHFIVRRQYKALPAYISLAILSLGLLELFDLLAVVRPTELDTWKKCTLVTEATIPPIWLWFSLNYARQRELGSISLFQRLILAASPIFAASVAFFPIQSFFYSPDFATEKTLFLGTPGFAFYTALVGYLIVTLINLENTLKSADLGARWKIKFETLGAGVVLAVMVFYYSQALIFRTINMHLVPARAVMVIVAVAMMAYSRLWRGNGVKIHVSRQMAYRSMVLLAVGIYLTAFGLVGEGLKYFGDGFQRSIIIAVTLLAGLALSIILLSDTAKRKLQVFIHKNFYQNKYDYRNQWLKFTNHLAMAKSGNELMQFIVLGFCETFGMGCGALFMADTEGKYYVHAAEMEMEPGIPRFSYEDRLIQGMSASNWIVDMRQPSRQLIGEDRMVFCEGNKLVFAVPLLMNGHLDGFIVLGRPLNRREEYTYEDYDLMKTLARQASSALLNLRLSDQLAHSREMAAIGKVSTFVIHDLKNLVSSLSLMCENAQEFITIPEFQKDLLTALDNTVAKMNGLISRLRTLPEKEALKPAPVDLLQLAHDTAALLKGGQFQVSGTSVIAEVDRDQFQKVALNLMLNAVEATGAKKPVSVVVGEKDSPFFQVKDEGCGIPEDFLRNKIFTPFKSTKKKGLGIGLYQCRQIVEAHGGTIEVMSEINSGSEFTVWLPKGSINAT